MKYILNEQIALRSWRGVPCAYYIKNDRHAKSLSAEDFLILMSCDGKNEQDPESESIKRLSQVGFIRPAAEGEELSEWQKVRFCDNRYMPISEWSITGRCNYNCLHCFMAKDNERLMSEFSWEEMLNLLDEYEKCGIQTFVITGGEPLLHPRFMDLMREISRRGMVVDDILTNGALLTEEIIHELKDLGLNPLFSISFDGIGHHDWMRGVAGAEKTAMRAIDLCLKEGMRVRVQVCAHRLNLDTMVDTVKLMGEKGVDMIRVIRTSESPRWKENAGDACLSIEEYFDLGAELLTEFAKTGYHSELTVWQFGEYHPHAGVYYFSAVDYSGDEERDLRRPTCTGIRGSMAIASDGEVLPCNRMAGYYAGKGYSFGNAKKGGIQHLSQDSDYLNAITCPVSKIKENPTCSACKYFKYCLGGCRVIALLFYDYTGPDISKCIFYNKGYYQKARRAFDLAAKESGREFRCGSPVPEFEEELNK